MAPKRSRSMVSDRSVSRKRGRGARGSGIGDRGSSKALFVNDSDTSKIATPSFSSNALTSSSSDSGPMSHDLACSESDSTPSSHMSIVDAYTLGDEVKSDEVSVQSTPTVTDKLMSTVTGILPALGGELASHVRDILGSKNGHPLAQMLRTVARFTHIMPRQKKAVTGARAVMTVEKGTMRECLTKDAEISNPPEVNYIWTQSSARQEFPNSNDTLVSSSLDFNGPSTSKCNQMTTPSRQDTMQQTHLSLNPQAYCDIKPETRQSSLSSNGDVNTNGHLQKTNWNASSNPRLKKNQDMATENSVTAAINCDLGQDSRLKKNQGTATQNTNTSAVRDMATHTNSDSTPSEVTHTNGDSTIQICDQSCDPIPVKETAPQKCDTSIHANTDSKIHKNGDQNNCNPPLALNDEQLPEICDLTLPYGYQKSPLDVTPMDLTLENYEEIRYPKGDARSYMDLTLDDDDDEDVMCIDKVFRKADYITSIHEKTLQNDAEDLANLFPEVSMLQKSSTSNGFTQPVKQEPPIDWLRWGRGRGGRGSRGRERRGRGSRGARGRRGARERLEGLEELDTIEDALAAVNNTISSRPMQTASIFQLPKDKAEDAEEEEIGVAETYSVYTPAKLKIGCAHPDPVVETASLSSVESGDITYQLSLPDETIRGGLLSALQLEAVVYASQAHEHVLPDGTRAGFLIGDGAGVGKGRTIAGIIFENYLKSRKRAVWVSVSNDLKYDAERDLRDIGAGNTILVHQLSKMKYCSISSPTNGSVTQGVVFSTYSSLIGYTASVAEEYNTRLKQLIDWCGPDFDGCIVFDECHRAKNLCPVVARNPSKTGLAVVNLQRSLPKARLVYASATGASEPKNMAYMVRLGIWGKGTPFHTFEDFLSTVEMRGVGAMEIVAMDMKLRGMYIARQLSFHGVTFKIEEVPLSEAFRDTYDKAVALWVEAMEKFQVGLELVNPSHKCRKVTWSQFWGAHQRFFKYLCIAAKVSCTVARTREALAAGKCVVIGLQSTGEARTLDQLEKDDGKLTEFICTAKGVFQSVVEKQFPDPDNMKPDDFEGPPAADARQQTQEMKRDLLKKIAELGKLLPSNTLDQLIDQLGGTAQVAEMTGRKGRVVQSGNGSIHYESRSEGSVPMEMLNMAEKQRFMDGEKNIAIISEAASSGISLQSDRRERNQRRRVHITLELPWSADRAIQQFGRTHRSNQVNAPEYIFLISDLAGERRFASTVAKRLESLGALTHGDRRATETRDLSQFNIENKLGRETLIRLKNALGGAESAVTPPCGYAGDFLCDAAAALRAVGVSAFQDQDAGDVQRFLNRLLGVPVKLQNALFQYFSDTFDAVVLEAKRNGKYDPGIQDLGSAGEYVHRVRCVHFVWRHATGTAPVQLHTVLSERGLDWSRADGLCNTLTEPNEGFYLSRARWNNKYNAILCVANTSAHHDSGHTLYNMYRPNVGLVPRPEPISEIDKNYARCSRLAAAAPWQAQYDLSLAVCSHKYWRGACSVDGCEVGLRMRTYYVLSGSVLAVWARLERVRMQVVRVKTRQGDKIVGTLLPKGCIDLLTEALKKEAISFTEQKFQ